MISLKIVSSDEKWDDLQKDYPLCKFDIYNPEYHKEKVKAFKLKAHFGTSMEPLCAVYEDSKLLKVFYSEDKQCTIDNVRKYLCDTQEQRHTSSSANTI